MTEHIQFLRKLIDELRNQRDEWREQSTERGMEIMRLRARNAMLERQLAEKLGFEDDDTVVLRVIDTGASQAERRW